MTTPNYRRCWSCGAINLHSDDHGLAVACHACGSRDTRRFKTLPPLWGTGLGVYVPKGVAKCPECDSELVAQCIEHEADTGRPVATGIELDCRTFLHEGLGMEPHTFSQDKWQPVRDAVAKWCGATTIYGA